MKPLNMRRLEHKGIDHNVFGRAERDNITKRVKAGAFSLAKECCWAEHTA